jgi:hypothetical protein
MRRQAEAHQLPQRAQALLPKFVRLSQLDLVREPPQQFVIAAQLPLSQFHGCFEDHHAVDARPQHFFVRLHTHPDLEAERYQK